MLSSAIRCRWASANSLFKAQIELSWSSRFQSRSAALFNHCVSAICLSSLSWSVSSWLSRFSAAGSKADGKGLPPGTTVSNPAKWFRGLSAGEETAETELFGRGPDGRWLPAPDNEGVHKARGPVGGLWDAFIGNPQRVAEGPIQGLSRELGPLLGRVGADNRERFCELRSCEGGALVPWDGPAGGDCLNPRLLDWVTILPPGRWCNLSSDSFSAERSKPSGPSCKVTESDSKWRSRSWYGDRLWAAKGRWWSDGPIGDRLRLLKGAREPRSSSVGWDGNPDSSLPPGSLQSGETCPDIAKGRFLLKSEGWSRWEEEVGGLFERNTGVGWIFGERGRADCSFLSARGESRRVR